MTTEKKLWLGLIALLAVSFSALLWVGGEIHRQMPPIPETVQTATGEVIYTRADIEIGRQVWQSIGGHPLGSIWGHGSYVAPDWTADWLHREAVAWLEIDARASFDLPYAELPADQQAALQSRLQSRIRPNTYSAEDRSVTVAPERAAAMRTVAEHSTTLFGDDPQMLGLRRAYATKNGSVTDAAHRQAMTAFFGWTAWSAVTERPGQQISFTANWPHEPRVGNTPASA